MIIFTKQERVVLFCLGVIFLSGSSIQYAFKKYPALKDRIHLNAHDTIASRVDINTASLEELVEVPYIGDYTAANILQYRQQYGPFQSVEQIKNVKGIKDKNYQKFRPYLKVVEQKNRKRFL
jgi:competence ComEA-like helix-hairpin-helix protein